MDSYTIKRISDLERAIARLKEAAALTKTSEYTIAWIRDNLETDASFYAWIVTSIEADTAFYTWFRTALNADATFISSLITSFEGVAGFTSWVQSTAATTPYYITVRRTATLALPNNTNTIVPWQASNRNSNFSFTPTSNTVAIPSTGYYNISFSGITDIQTSQRYILYVGGVGVLSGYNQALVTNWSFSTTNYYTAGQNVQLGLTSINGAAVLQVNAESAANQSPILHIVKVS
jgi:hypothetical protein